MLKFVAGVITTLLLIALIGGGYFWFSTSRQVTKPIPVISLAPTPTGILLQDEAASASSESFEKPITGFVNPSSTIEAIETALRTKLYGNLSAYMTASVSVTLNNKTTTMSKTAAIQQLKTIEGAKQPWNFSSTNPVAAQLIANNPLHFKDAFIGTADNFYAAGFMFDDVYLIRSIYLTANYRPLIIK